MQTSKSDNFNWDLIVGYDTIGSSSDSIEDNRNSFGCDLDNISISSISSNVTEIIDLELVSKMIISRKGPEIFWVQRFLSPKILKAMSSTSDWSIFSSLAPKCAH